MIENVVDLLGFRQLIFREIEDSSTYVTWIDNYNAKWRMKKQNIKKDGLQLANWTGIAVREYTGPYVDMTVRRNEEKEIIPALPDDLFQHIPAVIKFIQEQSQYEFDTSIRDHPLATQTGMCHFPYLFDTSRMVNWGVDRVPLKPNPKSPALPMEYKIAIEQSPDTLTNFYPKAMISSNIGSNVGIVKILKDFFMEIVQRQKYQHLEKYYIISCDENIYKRAMRVLITLFYMRNCILFYSRSTRKKT